MSPGLSGCHLILKKALPFTGLPGVYALDGAALAAGVPLLGEEELMRSSVSAVAANVISRCKDKSHMMRSSKESPVFASGQPISLWLYTQL
jgi:hypothetical protein